MPIVWDKTRKRYRYQLHRHAGGQRVRVNKILPRGWSRAQADDYDRIETARIIGEITGVQRRIADVETAMMLYLDERAASLKSHTSVVNDMGQLHPYYKNKTFDDLPAIARDYTRDHIDALKPATIRKRLTILRAACRYAWQHHDMGESAPGERMQMPIVKNARHVYPSRADIIRIARSLPRLPRAAILTAYYTGMRISEVLRAEATDQSYQLHDTKNSLPRHVPIHPRIAVYARHKAHWQDQRGDTISKQFQRACAALGITGVRLHDLRHAAASEMINAGIDLYTVGAVLGHKSATSTGRYAHLAQSRLQHAVNRIGSRILSPTTKTEKGAKPKKAA
jgi:integrase